MKNNKYRFHFKQNKTKIWQVFKQYFRINVLIKITQFIFPQNSRKKTLDKFIISLLIQKSKGIHSNYLVTKNFIKNILRS